MTMNKITHVDQFYIHWSLKNQNCPSLQLSKTRGVIRPCRHCFPSLPVYTGRERHRGVAWEEKC